MVDGDLNLMAHNSKFMELLDLPADRFPTGTSLAAFFRYNAERGEYGEGDIDEHVQSRVELARKFEAHQFERARPDGTVIEIRGNPMPDSAGFVTTYTDITERKRQEEALAAKEKQLRTALENMTDGMFVLDEALNYVLFNDQYVEMMSLSEKAVRLGHSAENAIREHAARGDYGPGEPDELIALRLKALANDEVILRELEIDGGKRIVELRKAPLDDGGAVVVVSDVTERKRAEDEIARQKQIAEAVLENMDQGILMFDGDLNVIAANRRYAELYGLEADWRETLTTFEDICVYYYEQVEHRADYDDAFADALAVARSSEPMIVERNLHDETIAEMRHQPMAGGGGDRTYTDITERKMAEHMIADAMALIHESIQYASRIQRSVLPTEAEMMQAFADYTVIWKPKDVVGGDMYLYRRCARGHLLMLMDCTGHGVPGAFMTMIATGAFDQALVEVPDGDPAAILQRTNQLVKIVLGQHREEGESDDGFECGLCRIDDEAGEITFAGARFELWRLENENITATKGDKIGIGYRRTEMECSFTNHVQPISRDSAFYMFSDGLTDQVGGDKRRAFGKRRMKGIILDYSRMKMSVQSAHILREFEEYQHDEERRDDITLIGFRPHHR